MKLTSAGMILKLTQVTAILKWRSYITARILHKYLVRNLASSGGVLQRVRPCARAGLLAAAPMPAC